MRLCYCVVVVVCEVVEIDVFYAEITCAYYPCSATAETRLSASKLGDQPYNINRIHFKYPNHNNGFQHFTHIPDYSHTIVFLAPQSVPTIPTTRARPLTTKISSIHTIPSAILHPYALTGTLKNDASLTVTVPPSPLSPPFLHHQAPISLSNPNPTSPLTSNHTHTSKPAPRPDPQIPTPVHQRPTQCSRQPHSFLPHPARANRHNPSHWSQHRLSLCGVDA